jgi:uncharacterized membrane protein
MQEASKAPSTGQGYWAAPGAVLAGCVCVVALALFFMWSLAAVVVFTAVVFLALVAMLAMLDLAPALGAPVQAHSRDAWLDFLVSVSMLTFVIGLVSTIFLIEYLSM